MEFRAFAQLMARYLRGRENEGEYCRTLLETIVEYPSDAYDYVHSRSSSALRSYFNGTRGIQCISRVISRNLDTTKFADSIRSLNDNVQQHLFDALIEETGAAPAHLFPDACAELFANIIFAAAGSSPGSDSEQVLNRLDVESGLTSVIRALGSLSEEELSRLPKKHMNGVRVKKKAVECSAPHIQQMTNHVVCFYKYIQAQMGICEQEGSFSFDEVAARVQLCYASLKARGIAQTDAYYRVANWIMDKTGARDRISCEILTSFFVQNCEVFDAPAK